MDIGMGLARSEQRGDPRRRIAAYWATGIRLSFGSLILRHYDLKASSFITKPATFGDLVNVVRSMSEYWFDTVRLPSH